MTAEQGTMQPNATVLLKFTIPELEPLPVDEQQRILTACWEVDSVQAAWRLYWSRPQQLPFIPIFPIAIYGALANIGLMSVFLVSLPLVFVGYLLARHFYGRRLVAALRTAVISHLPEMAPIQK